MTADEMRRVADTREKLKEHREGARALADISESAHQGLYVHTFAELYPMTERRLKALGYRVSRHRDYVEVSWGG